MKVFDLVKIAGVLILIGVWLDVIKNATRADGKLNILDEDQLINYVSRKETFEPYEPIVIESILKDFYSRNVSGNVIEFDTVDVAVSEPEMNGFFSAILENSGVFSVRVSFVPKFKFTEDFSVFGDQVVLKVRGRTKAECTEKSRDAIQLIKTRIRHRLAIR